jgi:hypothetical protein
MNHDWYTTVMGLAPTILAHVPNLPPTLIPIIVHTILDAEAHIPALSGPEKKQLVLRCVEETISLINAAKQTTVIDASHILPLVSQSIDATLMIVNLMHRLRA